MSLSKPNETYNSPKNIKSCGKRHNNHGFQNNFQKSEAELIP